MYVKLIHVKLHVFKRIKLHWIDNSSVVFQREVTLTKKKFKINEIEKQNMTLFFLIVKFKTVLTACFYRK